MHAADTAGRNEMRDGVESSALEGISNDGRHLTLAAIRRFAIESRIRLLKGNKAAAARSLGIGLETLYRKVKQYAADDDRRAAR